MPKNRTIPFRYMMKDGQIQANPEEVLAVVTIFSEYLAGKSLNEISAQMEVPYNDGLKWNKNMVKRILENEKYLGTSKYPQLISAEIFRAVNEKKTSKATCIVSDELQEVRNLTFCKECSQKLFRNKAEKWNCHNQECYKFEYQLTDEMLIGSILNILNAVTANPSLIDADSEVGKYISDSEIIRRQNEINRKIDEKNFDFDEIKNEIFRLAEMKYEKCTYSDIPQKTAFLKSVFKNQKQLQTLDTEFMKICVLKIFASHYGFIEIEFKNGVTVRNTIERKG